MKVASFLVDQQKLKDFCKQHHIRKLAVFGSVLRTDFTPQSDIDVLVEFYPGHIPGFFKLWEIEQELSEIFGGRKIDLITTGFISPLIKDHVLQESRTLYAEIGFKI